MYGGKNPDLIDSILDFFGGEVKKFDLLEGIDGVVLVSSDFENGGVGAITDFAHYFEIIEGHFIYVNFIDIRKISISSIAHKIRQLISHR